MCIRDSVGTITNSWELIIREVIYYVSLNIIFIEHYQSDRPNQFRDLVKFDFADSKGFRYLNGTHLLAEKYREVISMANEIIR